MADATCHAGCRLRHAQEGLSFGEACPARGVVASVVAAAADSAVLASVVGALVARVADVAVTDVSDGVQEGISLETSAAIASGCYAGLT